MENKPALWTLKVTWNKFAFVFLNVIKSGCGGWGNILPVRSVGSAHHSLQVLVVAGPQSKRAVRHKARGGAALQNMAPQPKDGRCTVMSKWEEQKSRRGENLFSLQDIVFYLCSIILDFGTSFQNCASSGELVPALFSISAAMTRNRSWGEDWKPGEPSGTGRVRTNQTRNGARAQLLESQSKCRHTETWLIDDLTVHEKECIAWFQGISEFQKKEKQTKSQTN